MHRALILLAPLAGLVGCAVDGGSDECELTVQVVSDQPMLLNGSGLQPVKIRVSSPRADAWIERGGAIVDVFASEAGDGLLWTAYIDAETWKTDSDQTFDIIVWDGECAAQVGFRTVPQA